MKMNFKGLVNLHNLPISLPLSPLFEAIVNSIQAIEERDTKDGKIEITIEREAQTNLFDNWETDIENIVIKDNGVGFTNDNYNSFDTYASEHKIMKGCKGVGRMLWLKAFDKVEIESVYLSNKKYWKRSFEFDDTNEIHSMNLQELDESKNSQSIYTIVKLINLKKDYKKACPKKLDTIARHILNHCFAYYILGKAPEIIISDIYDSHNVNKYYKEITQESTHIENLTPSGVNVQIIHAKNYTASNDKHEINLCAHQRVVQPLPLSRYFNVNSKLEDEKGEFSYSAYVLSDFLDNHVNRERTKFELPEEKNLIEPLGFDELISCIKTSIESFLSDDIKASNKKNEELIKNYIYDKNPKYRLLLKNCPDLLQQVMWSEDEDKLEMELFKLEQKYKLALKKEGRKLIREEKDTKDYKDYLDKCTAYAEKLSDVGKSNLAEYVMHRKAVLDILENNIRYQDEDKKNYAYEKNIHQIIFPMTKTSDDIDYMRHNLWIIDEKLAYHHYLASDMKLKSLDVIENKSGNEPDLVIFDSPFAFTDEENQPYRNITIIEFKRPGRESYSSTENPINQVIEYMDNIIEGKIKSKNGEFLDGTEDIRFYCYILCDVDKKIKKYAKTHNLKKTPDSMGFYNYLETYNAYIEIIPYNKMIQDSKKRNKILFDKLFNQY